MEKARAYQANRYASDASFRDTAKARSRAHAARHPTRKLFNRRKSSALHAGKEFTIIYEELVWPEYCPVLDIRLDYAQKEKRGGNYNSPSMDRIDNNKGYISGNVIIISMRANLIKRDATPEELMKIARFYTSLNLAITSASLPKLEDAASSDVVPGAVLSGFLAEKSSFVEGSQGPKDNLRGIGGKTRGTLTVSHDSLQ
jgi:hypothetical protein